MLKAMTKRMKNEKGFTLIELLAVIVILAVIAAIAVPMIGNIISDAKADSEYATARQLYEAARLYIIGEKNGEFKVTGGQKVYYGAMVEQGYLDDNLVNPRTNEAIEVGTKAAGGVWTNGAYVEFNAEGTLETVSLTGKEADELDADKILKGKAN